MNDNAFDRKMSLWAHRDEAPVSTARLELTLASLGESPGMLASAANASAKARVFLRATAPRRPLRQRRLPARALVVAAALMLLLTATALAATLGLSHFFEQNPYLFARQSDATTDAVTPDKLLLLSGDGLDSLRVEPVDSAWIDGRLTFSVLVTPADASRPLLVGELNGDGTASLYPDGPDQPPRTLEDAAGARILLYDNFAVYTMPDGGDGWPGYPELVDAAPQGDGTLFAMQIDPYFVSASELDALAQDGRFPFRLELVLSDGGALRTEYVSLSAVLATDEEKEVMNP